MLLRLRKTPDYFLSPTWNKPTDIAYRDAGAAKEVFHCEWRAGMERPYNLSFSLIQLQVFYVKHGG